MTPRYATARAITICAAACALACGGLVPFAEHLPTVQPAQAEGEDVDALAQRVEDLRTEMETVYLEVERDHARVRSETFAQSAAAEAFATALRGLVEAARADPAAASDTLVDGAVQKVLADGSGAPLSRTSLGLVLRLVVDDARKDAEATPGALFLARARTVFVAETAADAWDLSFQGIQAVREFRAANEALATALKRAVEPSGPQPGDAGTETDMVALDRARGFVGPWRGWVQSFGEKENRRTAASLRAIYVDRYEVTCAQYRAFLAAQKPNKRADLLPDGWKLADDGAVAHPAGWERRPVTGVTYAQALAYARHWGKRLPTEDEWELAAAGTQKEGRTFPWGSEPGDVTFASAASATAPVAVDAFPGDATPEGIVGMAGNVAEYVATLPDRQAAPKSRPPRGGEIVIRGGSFRAKQDECSTLWRWVADPSRPHAQVGFRCVMDEREYKRKFE